MKQDIRGFLIIIFMLILGFISYDKTNFYVYVNSQDFDFYSNDLKRNLQYYSLFSESEIHSFLDTCFKQNTELKIETTNTNVLIHLKRDWPWNYNKVSGESDYNLGNSDSVFDLISSFRSDFTIVNEDINSMLEQHLSNSLTEFELNGNLRYTEVSNSFQRKLDTLNLPKNLHGNIINNLSINDTSLNVLSELEKNQLLGLFDELCCSYPNIKRLYIVIN